jgi:uncharacterized damage-inducible protein DinB
MKKIVTLIFIALARLATAQSTEVVSDFKGDIVSIMKNMKDYTLEIANQMPEEKYGFRPVDNDTVRTFAEQLKHLTNAMNAQTENLLGGKTFDPRVLAKQLADAERKTMSKNEIIREMGEAFDMLIAKLSTMSEGQFSQTYTLPFPGSEPKSYRVLAMFIRDHISHHRAQAIVYLRMNGITPKFYLPF